MLRHFCLKPVSGNNTATAISMHCIVSLLKPRRALRHGYIQGVWATWAMGPMGNVDTGGNGVQGVWGTWAMRPTGAKWYRCMGHIGNRDTGANGVQGYGAYGQ